MSMRRIEAPKAFWPSRSLGRWQGTESSPQECMKRGTCSRNIWFPMDSQIFFNGFSKVCSKVWLINVIIKYRCFFSDDLLVMVLELENTSGFRMGKSIKILLFRRTNRVDNQLNKQNHRISSTDRPSSWWSADRREMTLGKSREAVSCGSRFLYCKQLWNGFGWLEDCWVSWVPKGMMFKLIERYDIRIGERTTRICDIASCISAGRISRTG